MSYRRLFAFESKVFSVDFIMNIRWKVRLARISTEHSEVFGSSHWKKKRGAMGFALEKRWGVEIPIITMWSKSMEIGCV